jgi:hypothetical protein
VEVVGRERELGGLEACSKGDTAVVADAAVVVAAVYRSWMLEAYSMGDRVAASAVAVVVVAAVFRS